MKTSKTIGIVLRRTNYGEADRVLQIVTPLGKRTAIAKGARKEKSRLAGGIELFAVSEMSMAEGKGEMMTLTSARLIHFYKNILSDYERLQFGYQAVKLITKSSEMIDSPEWYELLEQTLAGLDVQTISLDLVRCWFYLRYADLTGYELSLYNDVDGHAIEMGKQYDYDVENKGLIESRVGRLTSDHIKLLRLIATKPLKALIQIGGVDPYLGDCYIIARDHAAV